ncbi:MAG: thiamine-phosphate kinase [Endomicrobium sp.]|nr:thiamine-phosphate kinase [Endomicrobium sp.]
MDVITEHELINTIKERFANYTNVSNVITNIGDDAFCFTVNDSTICITKDILIENTHFKLSWISATDLGRKAIEVNISDIVAMGQVIPKYVFIGLGLPLTLSKEFILSLYQGFKDTCDEYKIAICGGDTVKAEQLVISITVIGISHCENKIISRHGANVGDVIGVTNTCGDAAAGLELLYQYGSNYTYNYDEISLIKKQNNPKARRQEAWIIANYASSLIDSSDCLYISIQMLIEQYFKGANIYLEKIPVSDHLRNVFNIQNKWRQFALFGGEDYELVFTVSTMASKILKKLLPNISYIGIVTNAKRVKYFYNGKEQYIIYSGYTHFHK